MDQLINYIKALVNLYGIVHIDKVVEIYNMQNSDQISRVAISEFILKNKQMLLNKHFVYINGDYFVSIPIMVDDAFDDELEAKKGKPYYIPEKEELLKYTDSDYFEINDEYEAILKFFKSIFWRKSKAENFCRDLQGFCKSTKNFEDRMAYFLAASNLKIRNYEKKDEFGRLLMALVYNTRVRQNNGFTILELEAMGFDR